MSKSETVLITGASSGIGLELARIFAENGHDLILTARNESALIDLAEQLKNDHRISVAVIKKDLSQPSAPGEIYDAVRKSNMRVSILVNNAGFGSVGLFQSADLPGQLNMIQVNVTALTHLTRLFLDDMIKAGSGKILNVASTAAFVPGPTMAVYYATKAYVLSFSEALASELEGTGITVTALCPGPTRTGFQASAGLHHPILFRLGMMTAEAVAKAGYRGLMRGKVIVVPGLLNKFVLFAVRFLPRRLTTKVVQQVHKERA